MAAHIKTGVEQILQALENDTIDIDIIRSAVDLSTFTEDNYKVWTALYEYVHSPDNELDRLRLRVRLEALQPEINIEWVNLGKPATREEWWIAVRVQLEAKDKQRKQNRGAQ